jgi:hypothetical protein
MVLAVELVLVILVLIMVLIMVLVDSVVRSLLDSVPLVPMAALTTVSMGIMVAMGFFESSSPFLVATEVKVTSAVAALKNAPVAQKSVSAKRKQLKRSVLVALRNVFAKKKELKRNALVVLKSGPVMPRSGLAPDRNVIATSKRLWLPSLCKT